MSDFRASVFALNGITELRMQWGAIHSLYVSEETE